LCLGPHEKIATTNCICRKQQSLLGYECSRVYEGCMGFGLMAELFLERGLGES
jgi:hypothetical protein